MGTGGALGTLGTNLPDPLGLSAAVFRKPPFFCSLLPQPTGPQSGAKVGIYCGRTQLPLWGQLLPSIPPPTIQIQGKAGSR